MGNDPILLTNLDLGDIVGRTDPSPCQRTQRWNTSKVCLLAVLITTLSWVVQENTSWARSRAQLQALMIFYTPAPFQLSSISLDACAMLCWGTSRRHTSAQQCASITTWPNTIQCLASDDIMSLGIKSFATEGVGTHNVSSHQVFCYWGCWY